MATRKKKTGNSIQRRAVRIMQNDEHPLFLFALTGDELLEIAETSRISRDTTGKLIGYQRAGVKRHVADIAEYLDQDDILFPNSIILALSSRVKFRQTRGSSIDGDDLASKVSAGTLEIPTPNGSSAKPAWIVDGQQRVLALSKCKRRGDFPIPVNAFVADEVDLQRDQFLRVNSSKPLPRGLITELLPEVTTILPSNLSAKQMPSEICNWLNQETTSPFCGLVRRASTPAEEKSKAIVADTSIVKMIEESLSSPSGCLFPYRNIATGETEFEGIGHLLVTYWSAVSQVFPDAWGKPPVKSRLMHGAGIRSMGRLMDKIMPSINLNKSNAVVQTIREIKRIAPICRWTKGRWEEIDGLRWKEVQNVPRHINVLSSVLIRAYLQSRGTG
jgi:DGQHR domain-containing protein